MRESMAVVEDPLTIIQGDALSSLRALPDESVQCCVTSPPYWGLRDYGLEPIVWGGAVECVHEWGAAMPGSNRGGSGPNGKNGYGEEYGRDAERGSFCQACGAWRGCLGLEPTPEMYVSHLLDIFRELKRVLRRDGTFWLNLGDSYANTGGMTGGTKSKDGGASRTARMFTGGYRPLSGDLKQKDLVGVPWAVAFALRADGWYLRSDIVWSKPNPMPESVMDRPTKSHEYIFLLSKSERYYYDQDAIREPLSAPEKMGRSHTVSLAYSQESGRSGDSGLVNRVPLENRNKRSVWVVPTQSFADAHFATFPPDLIKPSILAGSKAGDVVIDPFSGSGTTAKISIELGRKAIAIEPKAEYVEMIKKRCQTTIGLPLAI